MMVFQSPDGTLQVNRLVNLYCYMVKCTGEGHHLHLCILLYSSTNFINPGFLGVAGDWWAWTLLIRSACESVV